VTFFKRNNRVKKFNFLPNTGGKGWTTQGGWCLKSQARGQSVVSSIASAYRIKPITRSPGGTWMCGWWTRGTRTRGRNYI